MAFISPENVQLCENLSKIIAPPIALGGIIWGIIKYIQTGREDKAKQLKLAYRKLYQDLEMASIDLFRFEAAHPELIAPFWEDLSILPRQGTAAYTIYMNYFCQQMNLFEMAVRFYFDEVLEEEVFTTWLPWFFLVARAPDFPRIWAEQKNNYSWNLREMLDLAQHCEDEDDYIQKAQEFTRKHLAQRHLVKRHKMRIKNRLEPLMRHVRKRCVRDSEGVTLRWIDDTHDVDALVRVFLRNVTKDYISQGEIFCGRARQIDEWVSDLPAVLRKEFSHSIPARLSSDGGKAILGAWQGDQCVGLAIISVNGNQDGRPYAVLEDVVVDRAFRGHGVAAELLKTAEQRLRELGIPNFILESGKNNVEAHRALHALGFTNVSLTMMKNLKADVLAN